MVLDLASGSAVTENQITQTEIKPKTSDEEFWVFGYGSMVWKVDFPIESAHRGYIEGFSRRFYQNSVDHRGTAEKPGRVVTLIHSDPLSRVYGMGYKIKPDDREAVLEHLDYREINGYDRLTVKFHVLNDNDQVIATKDVLVYIAMRDNPSFAGFDDNLEEIAKQICSCAGKSGKNCDYVFKLADAMRQLYPNVTDPHLFELEKIVRRQMNKETIS